MTSSNMADGMWRQRREIVLETRFLLSILPYSYYMQAYRISQKTRSHLKFGCLVLNRKYCKTHQMKLVTCYLLLVTGYWFIYWLLIRFTGYRFVYWLLIRYTGYWFGLLVTGYWFGLLVTDSFTGYWFVYWLLIRVTCNWFVYCLLIRLLVTDSFTGYWFGNPNQ